MVFKTTEFQLFFLSVAILAIAHSVLYSHPTKKQKYGNYCGHQKRTLY